MAFWSFGSEVPTEPLIAALVEAGVEVALPRIADGRLEPRTWAPGEPVTETHFGAWEPEGGRVIEPGEIDVVATPGVAFDRSCGRVGYGGGFYDRFLPRTPALRVAMAFGVQVVEDRLPGASFDLPVHAIVTETETIRCGGVQVAVRSARSGLNTDSDARYKERSGRTGPDRITRPEETA